MVRRKLAAHNNDAIAPRNGRDCSLFFKTNRDPNLRGDPGRFRRGVVTVRSPELERSADPHPVAGWDHRGRVAVAVVDQGDRPQRDARESEDSGRHRADETVAVATHCVIELRLRLPTVGVVANEEIVVVTRRRAERDGRHAERCAAADLDPPDRRLALGLGERRGGEGGDDDGLLDAAAGEHLAAGVVGPLVVRVHAR